jgi:hypothetical protein
MLSRSPEAKSAKVVLSIEGGEVTPRAIRAGVHDLLVARRSERGIDQVDLTGLAEYG